MGADLKAVLTPPADASRVAAIRNSLNLNDDEALFAFGERARLEVVASVQRILAEVRSSEAKEAAELLKQAVGLVEALDPAALKARGWLSPFIGRRQRLAQFRAAFQHAEALVGTVAGDLSERADGLARRAAALDRLHAQAKTFILELDAYIDAGRLARATARDARAEALETIGRRLEILSTARRCAVEQLSLVRLVQNVDAPLAQALAQSARAARRWAGDWSELLGLTPERRRKRIRPDTTALYETKAQALEALVRPTGDVAEARRRRAEAEVEMEKGARALTAARRLEFRRLSI
jgi:uncharacterized protein YaaN involved in tellurite resistance